jgi:hypothetical protein
VLNEIVTTGNKLVRLERKKLLWDGHTERMRGQNSSLNTLELMIRAIQRTQLTERIYEV